MPRIARGDRGAARESDPGDLRIVEVDVEATLLPPRVDRPDVSGGGLVEWEDAACEYLIQTALGMALGATSHG